MRLFPQSLFGRLLVFLLSGLILAQGLSAAIQLYDRGQVLYRAVGGHIAQRIGAIVQLLDVLPPAERRRLVTALDIPPIRISLDIPWQQEASAEFSPPPLLIPLLRRYLPADRPLQVQVSDIEPPPLVRDHFDRRPFHHHRIMRGHGLQRANFVLQVGLADGAVVTFSQNLPEEIFVWPYRLLLILLVLLVSVVVLAVLAVHWLTRPLQWLAKAAEELGRDIQRPPLKETGPLEVRRAARAFNSMQTRLVRYIQGRGRILAAVSHDLKTPITRLRLRAELLDDERLKQKFLNDLDAMEAMVQATLDFMRGTEHNEPVVPVDIDALLESLQDDAQETGGKVILQGSTRAPFQGRPLALKRCFSNLVDNAIHYGRGAWILIKDSPEQLIIVVRDQGPGIPETELERVFEPFYRLEGSRSRNTGGTGLGLGIARNIARAHGGELSLHNCQEGGLEAVVELPR